MGRINRGNGGASRAVTAAFAAICVASTALPGASLAQQPAKPPAADAASQKQQAKETGKRAFEAGVKSHQAGKYQPAVDQISESLRLGGLAGAEMARALYIRGLSYKKLNKPGLAISDLTSALWLKNGLNDADRQSAVAERAEAYKLAGLSDGASVSESGVVTDPSISRPASAPSVTAAASAPAPPKAAAPAVATTASTTNAAAATLVDPAAPSVTRMDASSEKAREAAEARRIAAAPVEDGSLRMTFGDDRPAAAVASPAVAPTPEPAPTTAGNSSSPTAAPALSALPTEQPAATASTTASEPSSVSTFFSSLFGGGASTSSAPPPSASSAPATTASTGPQHQANGAATSGWQQTAVTTGDAPPAAKPAIKAAAQPAPAKPAVAPSGKYKLHIAAVRSRAEAEAMAQKLAQAHGAELASRTPTVDEAVIGSMGTFYRVRVGGYANVDEPRGVCNKLRTSGFDCLVVTN